MNAKAENRGLNYYTGAVIGGGSGYNSNQKSSAKVTIEDNAQVTAENSEHGIGAGIGAGACGTGEVIIGGKAQVKATGSAEYQEGVSIMVRALPLAIAERLFRAVVLPRTARINLLLPTTSRTVQK